MIVQQKQYDWEQCRANVESLKMVLVEKETKKADLERGIVQKEQEGQKNLEEAFRQMELKCEGDLATLEEEWTRVEAEMEMKIQDVQTKMMKVRYKTIKRISRKKKKRWWAHTFVQ